MNDTPQGIGYVKEIPGVLADYKLVIPGRLPGLNEFIDENRKHSQAGAKLKGKAQELVQWRIYEQLKHKPINQPVVLVYNWYEKNKKRDRDNVASFGRKVIQDALVQCRILYDDGWDYVADYIDNWYVDRAQPRIEVQFILQEGEVKCKDRRKKSLKK